MGVFKMRWAEEFAFSNANGPASEDADSANSF